MDTTIAYVISSRYTCDREMTTTTPPHTAVLSGPSQELLLSTGYLLKKLGFGFKEKAMDALEPTGLNPQHHAVLTLLDEGSCRQQGTLADRLGYDKSIMVGLLDDLEERGLIERRRDLDDRRRHVVSLTPAGREALDGLRAILKAVEKEFFSSLDASERRVLHELLLKLAKS
jgi:MarR family transcriptional regulator, lower aerobic nicotinate degradation pathway regulator